MSKSADCKPSSSMWHGFMHTVHMQTAVRWQLKQLKILLYQCKCHHRRGQCDTDPPEAYVKRGPPQHTRKCMQHPVETGYSIRSWKLKFVVVARIKVTTLEHVSIKVATTISFKGICPPRSTR